MFKFDIFPEISILSNRRDAAAAASQKVRVPGETRTAGLGVRSRGHSQEAARARRQNMKFQVQVLKLNLKLKSYALRVRPTAAQVIYIIQGQEHWPLVSRWATSSAKSGVHTYAEYAKYGRVTILHIAKGLYIFNCIFCRFFFAYFSFAYFAYFIAYSAHSNWGMFIFCIFRYTYIANLHILGFILHIISHILHTILHILHIVSHILHIYSFLSCLVSAMLSKLNGSRG